VKVQKGEEEAAIVECGGDVKEATIWLRMEDLAAAEDEDTATLAAAEEDTATMAAAEEEDTAATLDAVEDEDPTATLAAAEDEATPPPSSEKLVAQETDAPASAPTVGGGGDGDVKIDDKLLEALLLYGGSTAKELSSIVESPKSDVNSALYKLWSAGRVTKEGSFRPVWTYVAGEEDTTTLAAAELVDTTTLAVELARIKNQFAAAAEQDEEDEDEEEEEVRWTSGSLGGTKMSATWQEWPDVA
jgi:predicted transcriptional regulator